MICVRNCIKHAATIERGNSEEVGENDATFLDANGAHQKMHSIGSFH